MRLSDILSKQPSKEYRQVDGFLQNKKGTCGQNVKIPVGQVALNYFCKECEDLRTYNSKGDLSIIFVNKNLISVDCVLMCAGCGDPIPIWFLIESNGDITSQTPEVRIIKRCEKITAKSNNSQFDEYMSILNKAERAYNEGLGAGAIVYLRKVFEKITIDSANAINIEYDKYENGNPRNFSVLLKKVDEECSIIPREFSANRYKLFQELSNIVHGDCNEQDGLDKFEPLNRLVIGIIENVKNHKEMIESIKKLKWGIDKENNNE